MMYVILYKKVLYKLGKKIEDRERRNEKEKQEKEGGRKDCRQAKINMQTSYISHIIF